MVKSELIDQFAEQETIPRARAEVLVNAFFDAMASAFRRGEKVEIRGLGSFHVREYPGYSGRNPATGVPVDVGSKKMPFFRPCKELKDMVNGSREER